MRMHIMYASMRHPYYRVISTDRVKCCGLSLVLQCIEIYMMKVTVYSANNELLVLIFHILLIKTTILDKDR